MSQSPGKEHIRDMFASVAPRYDLLNSLLSLNRHRYWRRFAVEKCELLPGDSALDVGVGTGDLAIELARAVTPRMLGRDTRSPDDSRRRAPAPDDGSRQGIVVGVDFCRPMLEVAAEKLCRRGIENVRLIEGNAEALPVPSNAFKAATTGFTLRNVGNTKIALAEMTRAVEPGGRVVVLELSEPRGPIIRRVYDAYFHRLLPLIGRAVSTERGGAYDYLPASVAAFASREELKAMMGNVGLSGVKVYDLTAGIVSVYVGIKR